jgi:hypothetical protein
MDDTVEQLVSILRKFADDTNMEKRVTMDKRASKWGMEFNESKCKVMHMGHTPDSARP